MGTEPKLIAWVGGQFFMQHMEAEGFRVARIPLTKPEALTWDDIVARCGAAPDAVVYTDRSLPPPLLGVERFPALTAFYCIDSHIHSWYPLYAGTFDLCAASLKGDVPRFSGELGPGRILWLPPSAEDRYRPLQAGKEWDLLFVGTVDPETTPLRHAFLKRLAALFPGLAVRQGDFAQLFPRARVVLNIAERGDLNFRVFEGLACGACLLTPRIANGQDELFDDGVHFVTYAPDDAADAAAKACALLADDARREACSRAGAARIEAAHRPRHRARDLAALLRQGFDENLPGQRLAGPGAARTRDLRLLWLHWAEHCGEAALAAKYLAEARRLAPAAK
ncbi:MAG: glycosyltransferase [Proteobacteria bacterium]|nr:glycosyltransferase [Pseudomonadota bacterium]MBU1595957.1 glycosyltransferase [Pseudomonadota bacterium]